LSFYPLPSDAPLSDACEIFSKGVHRIPVVDENQKVTNVFTQSQFLKFLVEHSNVFGPDCDKTALELGLGVSQAKHNEIVKISQDIPAIHALKLIVEKNLSAVAVVDKKGQILSQFSASDLRGLNPNISAPFSIRKLILPVSKVIQIVRKENHQKKNMLVWCLPNSKLMNIVEHIYNNKVHRVYLLDSYTNLYGVISITDIAKLLQRRLAEQS